MTFQRFNEIRLLNNHLVRWRFISGENRWEIGAYRNLAATELMTSVTGEIIQRWVLKGPGTEEFSEALGMVVLSASLKVQSSRINGR